MIGFVDAVKLFFKRYKDFDGRSARAEYWWVQLFYAISVIILIIPMGLFSGPSGAPSLLTALPVIVFALIGLLPMIALSIRRFHDQDKSGWFLLLSFIPYVGGLIVTAFMCIPGSKGANRFGADPLGHDADISS